MENNKNFLYHFISLLLIICLSFIIDKTLGLINLKAAILAALTFTIIIVIQSYLEMSNNKNMNNILNKRLEELRNETTETVNNTINRIFLTQNNNFKTNQFSNVLNFTEVCEIEKSSKEIWIFAKNLEYEMTDNDLTAIVLDKLKNGCIYFYLVPDTPKIRQRVKTLLIKFKKANIPNNKIQFRFKEQDLLMSFFGITIYNPTVNSQFQSALDPTVIFFPDKKHLNDREDRMFITIFGKETIPVQEDFNTLWDASKTAKLNDAENLEIHDK
jgi:hypothetical protein